MSPLVAVHKTADGAICEAGKFDYSFKLRDWITSLDIHAGDKIEFLEPPVRDKAGEGPAPEQVAA